MRISDWSSDVCSSDLLDHGDRACDVLLRADRPVHLPVLEPAGLKPWTRRFLQRWLITGFFAVALVILLGNRWVINSTDAYIYKDWALMPDRSEEHTSELQSLMRISYAVFCLKKKNRHIN